jgi:4-amino-4-deoxy-L-arabinose transferase-like glycosyltransferase
MQESVLKQPLFWLFILAGLVWLLHLGAYPLIDVDEPRYAETAREMIAHGGSWVTPHFNSLIRFDKPPLFYWLVAGLYKVVGVSEWPARLASVLSASSILLMLYRFTKGVASQQQATWVGVCWVTFLGTFALARWAITDMTLCACMTGTALGLWWAVEKSKKGYYYAGLAAGLGLLAKGPIALMLPGGIWVLSLLLLNRGALTKALQNPHFYVALMLSFCLAAPWYIAMHQGHPDTFLRAFFILHNLERFTSTVSSHTGGIFYYVPFLLAGLFPWIILCPEAIRQLLKAGKDCPPWGSYAVIWFVTTVMFFSVSGTKLPTYILPALPAAAMILGWTLSRLDLQGEALKITWVLKLPAIVFTLIFAGATYCVWSMPYLGVPQASHLNYQPIWLQLIVTIALIMFWDTTMLLLRQKGIERAVVTLITGSTILYVLGAFGFLPMFTHVRQSELVSYAQKAIQNNKVLATYGTRRPSLVFYAQKRVYYLPTSDELREGFGSVRGNTHIVHERDDTKLLQPLYEDFASVYVITKTKQVAQLQAQYPKSKLLEKGSLYSLLEVKQPKLNKDVNQ